MAEYLKKIKKVNDVGEDGEDVHISDEEMMKMAQERSMRKKMNKMMNRRTLMHDERLTQKTRSNLYDKYFKEED